MQFLFDDYALDVGRRELRRGGAAPIEIEPQVFDLLVYLIQNRDRVATKDDLIASVWQGRIVSDSTLTSRITAARKAIGDSGEQQALIRTIPRKGIRFVGTVREEAGRKAVTDPPPATKSAGNLRQDVHFCTVPDGTQIAYASVGKGPPIIKTGNWLNHLEYDWESPVWSPLFQAIAAEHQFIRYDARGNGLSDWNADDISLDAFVRDLETVVEAVAPPRFSLFGMSQGASVAIAYAVAHPDRVSHLVLAGAFARGRAKRGSVLDAASAEAMITLMRQGWGQENPAFRQLFTSLFIPGGTPEQMQWWNDLQRMTTSPDNAVRLRAVVDQLDIIHLLPRVTVPTLVLHCRDDAVQPFDEGRRVAAGIPGARFVAIEGRNHVPLKGEPAWDRLLQEMRDFIRT